MTKKEKNRMELMQMAEEHSKIDKFVSEHEKEINDFSEKEFDTYYPPEARAEWCDMEKRIFNKRQFKNMLIGELKFTTRKLKKG